MKSRRKSPVNTVTTEPQHCSIDLRLKILGRLPFFAGLSAAELELVNQRFVEMGFEAGQPVYQAGDPGERLYVVADGKVKLLQHAAGGRSVLIDILTSGEFFGSLAAPGSGAYTDTALAQTPSCVLSIRTDDFRRLLDDHPDLALRTLAVLAERLQAANQRVLRLTAMPVEQRIAATLAELARKHGRPGETGLLIDVPLSREDLAGMTGATTETVSRVISQLHSQGIITSGRQWLAISDPARIAALANPDPADL